ncbi:MAG TPA: helix-turn-helix transcriptional regulator, partial [Caulobacteraceae bacterium]|nr:helix-turn-helix transcriptional regulator [Caulobacteraceae bacterium]
AAWRLRLIDERLAKPGAPPSLPELASLAALSVRQLTRAFRASRGCSLGDHIADVRIERAKRLLTGQDSIKAIARELGFPSGPNFCRAFSHRAGMTPRQFRAQAKARVPAS